MFEILDRQVCFVDFLLDCLLHDPPEEGGGQFAMMLAILARIREAEDIRDPSNTRIYKIAEITVLCTNATKQRLVGR